MLSAIISTRESERSLVPTLAALVPGVTAGLLTDVIVSDAGSRDATGEVADIAGCTFLSSDAPLGRRLADAARAAKGDWLLFLRAGTVPDAAWLPAAEDFIRHADQRAAAFRRADASLAARIRAAFAGPTPEQGLLVGRSHYDALGGHRGGDDAETDLLRRIGRRQIVPLRASVMVRRDT